MARYLVLRIATRKQAKECFDILTENTVLQWDNDAVANGLKSYNIMYGETVDVGKKLLVYIDSEERIIYWDFPRDYIPSNENHVNYSPDFINREELLQWLKE